MKKQLSALQKRRQNGIIAMALLFVLFSIIFYISSTRIEPIIFGFYLGDEWKLISEWKIGSKSGVLIFLLISLMGIIFSYTQFIKDKKLSRGSFLFGFGSIMAFLCWAAAGKFIPLTGMLQAAVLLSVPLIFGSMAGLLCEKSGVINIAIEGQLLFAAFISAVIASLSQNLIWGLVSAPIAGAVV